MLWDMPRSWKTLHKCKILILQLVAKGGNEQEQLNWTASHNFLFYITWPSNGPSKNEQAIIIIIIISELLIFSQFLQRNHSSLTIIAVWTTSQFNLPVQHSKLRRCLSLNQLQEQNQNHTEDQISHRSDFCNILIIFVYIIIKHGGFSQVIAQYMFLILYTLVMENITLICKTSAVPSHIITGPFDFPLRKLFAPATAF